MTSTPQTTEEFAAKIPALQTLMTLGWSYVPPAECMEMREGNQNVLLKGVLVDELKKRRFTYRGKTYPLSTNAIDQIVREIASPTMNEGLMVANERLYHILTLGVTVTEFIDGKKHSPTISIIEWDDPTANSFIVTEELEVASTDGTHTRRPDLVGYVNGIPLVVIEAKRPESGNPNKSMVDEGISQNIRNQGNGEIPHLFAYSQLLLSISGSDGRYATTGTPKKFWALWRDEEFGEDRFHDIKNELLSEEDQAAIFRERPPFVRAHFEELWAKDQLPTDQDRLLVSLLSKDRLLEFVRFFILFDKKDGKIAARYQQAFGIKNLIKRINERNPDGGRAGGIIWHTTGSGKSFTMVFLCKALLLEDSLKECRVIVVTDRTDLEKQLARTFLSGGAFGSEIADRKEGSRAKVTSGKDLARRIGKGTERIIFAIINKFNTASKLKECHNPSDNLIVLVDEGHRSQGGENHERMKKALPNASYIAFTGTPLLKDQRTANKFGPIVHAYTMQRAVEDRAVTPLLYEERKPILGVNEKAIDNWFEKITAGLSGEQKSDLKEKYGKKGPVYGSENRIEMIAWDIAVHFNENFKELGNGLKGQLAADSKRSAIRYKKALDTTGLVTSAVVISPPDTREGHEVVDESDLPEVQEWWAKNVKGDPEEYEREVIDDFSTEGKPDILIVVDKLLTGFDEPRNAVLYIDKPLKQHNLIQAIARVNRLHEEKKYGLLIDYRGILKELDTALKEYQDLAAHSQAGYDIDDIDGLYRQVSTEYKKLPDLHEKVRAIFKDVENEGDAEQYRQILIPHYEEDENGDLIDTRQKVREDFYEALTEFGLCLKVALSSRSFFEDPSVTEALISAYKKNLRFFSELRVTARRDAQETVDYSAYEDQIRKLVDRQVIGQEIKESEGAFLVNELAVDDDPKKWSEEKTRNETDLIKSRIKRTIEQELADDPYAQVYFSELLRQAIAEAAALFDHPFKQYTLFKDVEEQVDERAVEGVPESLMGNRHARAYFGLLKMKIGDDDLVNGKASEFAETSIRIEKVVKSAVAEHSLNPQNIEAEIRKALLPELFELLGLDKAKEVIEAVIEVTRVGLSRGDLR